MKQTILCVALLAIAGCSESRVDPTVELDAATDTSQPADTSQPTDASQPTDNATPADRPPVDVATQGQLVVNEISAVGAEWVELYNAGGSPVSLSEVQVADSESDGGPRASRAMRFPAGTMLGAGQYVLVLANQSDAGAGPQTACLDGGPSTCFHAGWSLSASRGETVWVLSSTGEVTLHEAFPMNGTPDGGTWGRLPNGAGSFTTTRPTPGATNAAL